MRGDGRSTAGRQTTGAGELPGDWRPGG